MLADIEHNYIRRVGISNGRDSGILELPEGFRVVEVPPFAEQVRDDIARVNASGLIETKGSFCVSLGNAHRNPSDNLARRPYPA